MHIRRVDGTVRRRVNADRPEAGGGLMLGAAAAPLKKPGGMGMAMTPRARSALGCSSTARTVAPGVVSGGAVAGGGGGGDVCMRLDDVAGGGGGGGGVEIVAVTGEVGGVRGMATGRQLSGLSMAAMVRELGEKVVTLENEKKAMEGRLEKSEAIVAERIPLVRELERVREVAARLEHELANAMTENGELKKELNERVKAAARWRPSRVGTPATVGTPRCGVSAGGNGGNRTSAGVTSGRGERGSFERGGSPLRVDDLDSELRAALEAVIPEEHRRGDREAQSRESDDYERGSFGGAGGCRQDDQCSCVAKDVRVATLMRMLDDRTAAEAERAAAAARAKEAVEARLAAAEREAASERAGRVAAEREAAAVISRVRREGRSSGGSVGGKSTGASAPMLGVTSSGGSGGRGRRRVERFFTWAVDGGRDDEGDDLRAVGVSPTRS